jgi:hypothetical protein
LFYEEIVFEPKVKESILTLGFAIYLPYSLSDKDGIVSFSGVEVFLRY